MDVMGSSKAQFFKSMKLGYNKCLSPDMICPHQAIRAHSVQKSAALSQIVEDGHVCEIRPKIVGDDFVMEFASLGINRASTFTGFCSIHDTRVFLPIDTKPLNVNDSEQLFLIAYRSVTRELHAALQGALRLQATHSFQVEQGLVRLSVVRVMAPRAA